MPAQQNRMFICTLNNPETHYGKEWLGCDYLQDWAKFGAQFVTG